MNAVLSVQGSAVPEKTKPSFMSRVFNKKKALKAAKVALPVAAVAAFFPDAAMATTTATDLMKSGDATVKGTFGKQSSVVKWVVLAEVVAGGIMYMMTKKREVPVWLRDYFHLYHHRYVGRRLLTGST
ncbi:IncF plasmid conjugative transfer pilin protein TraA [Klebsiella pneumoniae IS43]|uniref:Pilin n=35 Tax=Klebsiella/Raoultella group TaxID=2890311 RepID=W1DGH1_KLEPN|nr:IncF plasmid conjugative transfer pilin protein TraA [Klebsiella pneumoniae IS43]